MIYYDSHVHTAFSTDSKTPMADMVRQGIQNQLKAITFTDHMDYHFPLKYNWDTSEGTAPFTFDIDRYIARITELKQLYQGQIDLYCGVEIGLKEDASIDNFVLSQNQNLDYAIGSIHLVDNMDPYYSEYWESFGEEHGLLKYFEATLDNLQNLGEIFINTLGHLDYIVRYAPSGYQFYSYQKFAGLIDEILRILVHRGIALEVNTSGYKNGSSMPNPNEEIIQRYRELGGEQITFGSDAHTPDLLSKHFDDAEKIVRHAGFSYYTTFIQRKPVFHKF